MSFVIGETVGQYRLIEQLGQGGMATVYKAYHPRLERYVAIKVLHPAFLEDKSFLARFQREARMIARLEHPNIVPVYDFADHEGRPYLVMKYIEGETLKALLERRRLSLQDIIPIINTVGLALDYAHKSGVLHRDIKPSNVLMANGGQIYLADFGLARMAESGGSSLTADQLVGTPQYISPEQALGRSNLDGRTDIYSLGIMTYEMVVGRVPFSADTPFAIIHDHIYTPLPLPHLVNPAVSNEVEQVLLKALAKNPDDRFQTVSEFVRAFENAVLTSTSSERTNGPVVVPPPAVMPAYTPETAYAQTMAQPPVEFGNNSTQAGYPTQPPYPSPVYGPPPQIKPVSKSKPSKRTLIILGIGALLVLVLSCLVILPRLGAAAKKTSTVNPTSSAVTLEATLIAAPVGTPNASQLEAASKNMRLAIDYWTKQDVVNAAFSVQEMMKAADGNPDFLKNALQTFEAKQAWVLVAFTIFESNQREQMAGLLGENPLDIMHMVLYMAAKDPSAGKYLQNWNQRPALKLLMTVPMIRNELYNGNSANAITDLNRALNNKDLVSRSPEIFLVDIEASIQSKDLLGAGSKLKAFLTDPNFPKYPTWIQDRANELDQEISK